MECGHSVQNEIGIFTEKHGVNMEWLVEGNGRVLKNDLIAPNSTMHAAEFAALVRTLPEAQERKIDAVGRSVFGGAQPAKRWRRSLKTTAARLTPGRFFMPAVHGLAGLSPRSW